MSGGHHFLMHIWYLKILSTLCCLPGLTGLGQCPYARWIDMLGHVGGLTVYSQLCAIVVRHHSAMSVSKIATLNVLVLNGPFPVAKKS